MYITVENSVKHSAISHCPTTGLLIHACSLFAQVQQQHGLTNSYM